MPHNLPFDPLTIDINDERLANPHVRELVHDLQVAERQRAALADYGARLNDESPGVHQWRIQEAAKARNRQRQAAFDVAEAERKEQAAEEAAEKQAEEDKRDPVGAKARFEIAVEERKATIRRALKEKRDMVGLDSV